MTKRGTVLIIDDDEDVLLTGRMILRPFYQKVLTETSPKNLHSLLDKETVDVIILDMNFKTGSTSGNEGLFWLRSIKEIDKTIKVIMNTAYGDIQLAVECMKEGAADFLVKPWEKEKLLTTVENQFKLKRTENRLNKAETANQIFSSADSDILGKSEAMHQVFEMIEQVAATDANVLITGENGTGKELVAKAIHNQSTRKGKSFIKADLGSISGSLFESELFGYKKGAFTDAKEDRLGRFAVADEGTMFLDEIGNITLDQQAKLLTVLQNRQVIPIGDVKPQDIDIRLIAATNIDIHEAVAQGSFRQDLLFRINTIEIKLPPLRERGDDVLLLAEHFLAHYATKYNKGGLKIPDEAKTTLKNYDWPGNIRELQHTMERAVILSKGTEISLSQLITTSSRPKKTSNTSLKVEDIERETIEMALAKCDNNLTKAANELGMGRSTLYRKMEKYGLK